MFSIDKTFPRYIFNNCFQQHTWVKVFKMDQVKLVEDSLLKIWSDISWKILKGCLPQILLPWPIFIINVNRPYLKLKQSVDAGVENKSNFFGAKFWTRFESWQQFWISLLIILHIVGELNDKLPIFEWMNLNDLDF